MRNPDKDAATVESLKVLLASSYTLYLKTHNFHWNVKGPMFTTLHNLFEEQYTDLALAVDEIAERIRALGEYAPGSYAEFGKLSKIDEASDRPDAESMIKILAKDQQIIAEICHDVVNAAGDASDDVSEDMAISRSQVHQKNAWMLSAHLA